jgi:cold shock CspA family protein
MLSSGKQVGTLTTWKDDKGYGFLEPEAGGSRVFLHISALPYGSPRPKEGDRLVYSVETQADGRLRAVKASYPRATSTPQLSVSFQQRRDTPLWVIVSVIVLFLGVGIGGGYAFWQTMQAPSASTSQILTAQSPPQEKKSTSKSKPIQTTKRQEPKQTHIKTPKPKQEETAPQQSSAAEEMAKDDVIIPKEESDSEDRTAYEETTPSNSGIGQGLIKGNISYNSNRKYYHVPGSADYENTIIDPKRGERYFRTEEEAIAAGWVKAPPYRSR